MSFQEERTDSVRPSLHRQPHLANDRVGAGELWVTMISRPSLVLCIDRRHKEIWTRLLARSGLGAVSHAVSSGSCLELPRKALTLLR